MPLISERRLRSIVKQVKLGLASGAESNAKIRSTPEDARRAYAAAARRAGDTPVDKAQKLKEIRRIASFFD